MKKELILSESSPDRMRRVIQDLLEKHSELEGEIIIGLLPDEDLPMFIEESEKAALFFFSSNILMDNINQGIGLLKKWFFPFLQRSPEDSGKFIISIISKIASEFESQKCGSALLVKIVDGYFHPLCNEIEKLGPEGKRNLSKSLLSISATDFSKTAVGFSFIVFLSVWFKEKEYDDRIFPMLSIAADSVVDTPFDKKGVVYNEAIRRSGKSRLKDIWEKCRTSEKACAAQAELLFRLKDTQGLKELVLWLEDRHFTDAEINALLNLAELGSASKEDLNRLSDLLLIERHKGNNRFDDRTEAILQNNLSQEMLWELERKAVKPEDQDACELASAFQDWPNLCTLIDLKLDPESIICYFDEYTKERGIDKTVEIFEKCCLEKKHVSRDCIFDFLLCLKQSVGGKEKTEEFIAWHRRVFPFDYKTEKAFEAFHRGLYSPDEGF